MGNSILKHYNSLNEKEKVEFLNKMSESVKKECEILGQIMLLIYDITYLYDNIEKDIKQKFLVILMNRLGYKKINNEFDYQKNVKIMQALIPTLNLKEVVYIYTDDKIRQIKFLENIKIDLHNLIKEKYCKVKEKTWKKF